MVVSRTSLERAAGSGNGGRHRYQFLLFLIWIIIPAFGWAQVPTELDLDLWANGNVYDMSQSSEGSLYVAGFFSLADRSAASNLARMDANGNLDSSFRPAISGFVAAVQSLPTGGVLVGGDFTAPDFPSVQGLAKIEQTGNLASDWSASADAAVLALHLRGEDHLYIGGRFSQVNGEARSAIARLSVDDGSLDDSFTPTVNGIVLAVVSDAFGNIWVAGGFDEVNGQSTDNLVVLDSDGNVLRTFSSDAVIRSIGVGDANDVYVCGDFSLIEGVPRSALARFSAGAEITLDSFQVDVDGRVFHCLSGEEGLWIGGELRTVNGVESSGLSRVSADGVVDTDFKPGLSGFFVGKKDRSARVISMALRPSGDLAIGGLFSESSNQPVSALAVVDGSTGGLVEGYELERRAEVRSAVSKLNDGSMIIGGSFRRSGETLVSNILRLQSDGVVDEDWPLSADGPVITSLTMSDGSLVVGGFFGNFGGEARGSLVRISNPAIGQLDEEWVPEWRGSVHALHLDECSPDNLYVGGFVGFGPFSDADQRVNFGKFSLAGGGEPESFDIEFNQQVNSIVQMGCGRVLIGGLFDQVGGFQRRGLALVETDFAGSVVESFDANLNGSVWSLLRVDNSEKVFVGGEFTRVFGQSRRRVAKLNPSLSAWNPGTDGVPVAMATDGLGGLYLVGTFTQFAGAQRARIAKTTIAQPAVLDSVFNPGSDGQIVWGAQVFGRELFISGDFKTVGGVTRRAVASFEVPVALPSDIFSDRFQSSKTSDSERFRTFEESCKAISPPIYGFLPSDQPFGVPSCDAGE